MLNYYNGKFSITVIGCNNTLRVLVILEQCWWRW